jgi:hypothetical protein
MKEFKIEGKPLEDLKTVMIFRKYKNGEVIALMPYEIADMQGHIMSYMHQVQHCATDYNGVVSQTKLAKPEEYAELLKELEWVGYEVKANLKRNHNVYLKEYYRIENLYKESYK